jgi:putative transposase
MNTSTEPHVPAPHKGWHHRGYLPHFDGGAVVQSITFRMADSLPRHVYEQILAAAKTDEDRFKRLEGLIDRGRGACILKRPEIAALVENALLFFDGERYRLLAWTIMPNHVHVMIEQIDGYSLGSIMHSWKSFTAKAVNKLLGSNGTVWSADYHDRYIRNLEHYEYASSYIEQNPVKAGLVARAEDWRFSSASRRLPR